MKKPRWVNLAIISIFTIGFLTYVFWDKSRETVPSPILSLEPTPSMATTTKTPLYTPASANDSAPSQKPSDAATSTPVKDAELNPLRKTIAESMPLASEIREQAIKDPHATPPAAIQFGMFVGRLEQDSIGSEADSKSLMTELEACGLSKDADRKVPSVQAICLQVAHDLQKKWPSLKDRYESLMKRTNPQAAAMAQSTR